MFNYKHPQYLAGLRAQAFKRSEGVCQLCGAVSPPS